MRRFSLLGIGLLLVAEGAFTGCSSQKGGPPPTSEKASQKGGDDDHDHGPGPHGGTIIEFGGKYHGEFTVNHKAQEATVYILGSNAKTPAPIKVEKLLLSINNPQFQIELKPVPQPGDPEGKSSRFVGKDERFAKEQEYEGTLSGVVDGKPYAGDFKEEPEKKDKK